MIRHNDWLRSYYGVCIMHDRWLRDRRAQVNGAHSVRDNCEGRKESGVFSSYRGVTYNSDRLHGT